MGPNNSLAGDEEMHFPSPPIRHPVLAVLGYLNRRGEAKGDGDGEREVPAIWTMNDDDFVQ